MVEDVESLYMMMPSLRALHGQTLFGRVNCDGISMHLTSFLVKMHKDLNSVFGAYLHDKSFYSGEQRS